jgi:hypothetical protein
MFLSIIKYMFRLMNNSFKDSIKSSLESSAASNYKIVDKGKWVTHVSLPGNVSILDII